MRQIQSINLTPEQLESFVTQVATVGLNVLLDYLQKHFRTGNTMSSVNMRFIERSPTRVTIGVGSQTRGHILRWLDRGRGEVYPVRAKRLRWLSWPEGIVIFARHARATQPSNIMQAMAEQAMSQAPAIAEQTLRTQRYIT